MVVLITTTTYLATTRQRVCCVYLKAPIVYVCVPLVYVDFYKNPFIYRAFQHFSCMFARFHSLIFQLFLHLILIIFGSFMRKSYLCTANNKLLPIML